MNIPKPNNPTARFSELVPGILTVKSELEQGPTPTGQIASTAIAGFMTFQNARNVTEALKNREWAAAGVAAVSTAFWGEVASYHMGNVRRNELPEGQPVTGVQRLRGYAVVGAITASQRFVNHRLGK